MLSMGTSVGLGPSPTILVGSDVLQILNIPQSIAPLTSLTKDRLVRPAYIDTVQG